MVMEDLVANMVLNQKKIKDFNFSLINKKDMRGLYETGRFDK